MTQEMKHDALMFIPDGKWLVSLVCVLAGAHHNELFAVYDDCMDAWSAKEACDIMNRRIHNYESFKVNYYKNGCAWGHDVIAPNIFKFKPMPSSILKQNSGWLDLACVTGIGVGGDLGSLYYIDYPGIFQISNSAILSYGSQKFDWCPFNQR